MSTWEDIGPRARPQRVAFESEKIRALGTSHHGNIGVALSLEQLGCSAPSALETSGVEALFQLNLVLVVCYVVVKSTVP